MRNYNKIISFATVSSVIFFSLRLCVGVPLSWRVDGKKTEVRLTTNLWKTLKN